MRPAARAKRRLAPIIHSALQEESLPNEVAASFRNQLQRLLYGMGRYEEALEVAEEVIRLNPNEPSFFFNASLIYEKLGQLRRSAAMVDQFMELGTSDDDHLHQAVEIYAMTDQIDKAREAHAALREVSPFKAVLFDEEIRQKLGIDIPGF